MAKKNPPVKKADILRVFHDNPTATNEEVYDTLGVPLDNVSPRHMTITLSKLKAGGYVEIDNSTGCRVVTVLKLKDGLADAQLEEDWKKTEFSEIYYELKRLFLECNDVTLLNAKNQTAQNAMKALGRA